MTGLDRRPNKWLLGGLTACAAALLSFPAQAAPALAAHQVPLELNEASAAWILTSTALVLLMTLPGLALFYGGMVRKKNVISTITQSVAVTAVVAVAWMVLGYSLAFGVGSDAPFLPLGDLFPSTWQGFIGSFDAFMLNGVGVDTAFAPAPGLPEPLWVAYQLTFAIITPALITGAFAERMKFSGLLLFSTLWSLLVYAPICHWVWGGGFLGSAGVLDFAGGAVVHVNSGVAGLVCALFLGKREGYGSEPMPPHNLVLTMIGASLLFVGWIGFNAGSAWAADGIAAMAILNTLIAPAAAALSWKIMEWVTRGKPSLLGVLSGLIAGLVGVTPAAGFVDPKGALIIGFASGAVCFIASVWIKKLFKYDDSLDAFGIHGAGGIVGALLTAVFATTAVNAVSEGANIGLQIVGLVWTIVWSAAVTFGILLVCQFTTGLRVSKSQEDEGLDSALHGEALHH